jgi:MATE family multidrug resistance protein
MSPIAASTEPGDPRASSPPIASELRALAVLAAPLVATNVGNMMLALVDVAIVGRLGPADIAAAGLGNAIFFLFAIFGMGLMFGLDPLIAQAIGAGEPRLARRLLWQGIWIAVVAAVPLSLGVVAVAASLERFAVPADVIEPTAIYLHARLPSMLPFLLLNAARSYLQARGHTGSLILAVVIANVINVPVATSLSFGAPELGIPGAGIAGAGWATAIATIAQLAVTAAPIALLAVPGGRRGLAALDLALAARALRIGAAVGIQFVIEAGSFSIVTFLVSRLGTAVLGGHQVALTLVSITFQIALGIGAATGVRVGHAIGRSDRIATRRAGIVGICAGTVFTLLGALAFVAIPDHLAGAMTIHLDVVRAATPLIFVAGWFQLSDGIQTIAQGALRGAGDAYWPLAINLAGHYAIGLPLGIGLAFGLGLGARGLWWGLALGLTVVAIAMTARFAALSRRDIARA